MSKQLSLAAISQGCETRVCAHVSEDQSCVLESHIPFNANCSVIEHRERKISMESNLKKIFTVGRGMS